MYAPADVEQDALGGVQSMVRRRGKMDNRGGQRDAPEAAGNAPPARALAGPGDLLFARLATLGVAGYACITSMSAPRSIIFSDCIIGRDAPYLALYRRVPCALVALLVMAWAAARYLPAVAKFTRCSALISAVLWGLSVVLARGWW